MSDMMNYYPGLRQFAFPEHPLYTKYKDQWSRIRDVLEGSDAVKAKGQVYLPKLSKQEQSEYDAYKTRGLFYNLSSRIVNTNAGLILRRSPTLKYNEEMSSYFTDPLNSFLSFNELFRFMTKEIMATSKVGILVDIKNNIPVPIKFPSENVINWIEDESGNVTDIMLVDISLKTDPVTFEQEEILVYKQLTLFNGVYTVIYYDENGTQTSFNSPSLFNKTLDYIPFISATVDGIDLNPTKSPILEIVDVNLSHFRTSCDLEHGRHFVALPTPIITGATATNELHVGSTKAFVIPSDKAKAYYLEFLGGGLGALENALKEKQGQISQFSAQLMDTSVRGSEAEGTVRLRYSSDAANLTDIAVSSEQGLNAVYGVIADWLGTEAPRIELNKDFLSTKLSPAELRELTKSLVDGAITEEVFLYNLERGEMTPPKKNSKE